MPRIKPITTAEELAIFLRRRGGLGGVLSAAGRMSWAELINEAVHKAEDLQPQVKGELIGLSGEPSLETIRKIFTVWAAGAIPVLLNHRLPYEPALEQCRRSGCRFFYGPGEKSPELLSFQPKARSIAQDRSQWATILFTTGSTGEPKACVHTFRNHFYSALGANENMPLTAGDRWLLSLPLFHVGGLGVLFRTMLSGASVVIPPEPSLSASLDFTEP
ncbi:MAG: AMP-binding protein, partial [candidate division KSB1 bacterium]|nr:AMP-binding protein [candidate division KSB1 bacterium]